MSYVAQDGKPLPEPPEDSESSPLFGPFFEFEWRESLPADAKSRLHAEWRDDIETAVRALEVGSAGLVRGTQAGLQA